MVVVITIKVLLCFNNIIARVTPDSGLPLFVCPTFLCVYAFSESTAPTKKGRKNNADEVKLRFVQKHVMHYFPHGSYSEFEA